MEPYELVAGICVIQMLSAGCLVFWWAGVYLIREKYDSGGWGYLGLGTFMLLFLSWLSLWSRGWVGFGLIVGLPALLSIPAYWAYRSIEQAKVFIGAAIALAVALLILVVVVWYVVIPGGPLGYGSLAAGALASSLSVYLWRKYTLRTPAPDDRQRAASDRWVIIGTILGLTVGTAILRWAIEVLGPTFSTVILAFLGGWLGFSILGFTVWLFLREVRK
jgi:hypothetical protein